MWEPVTLRTSALRGGLQVADGGAHLSTANGMGAAALDVSTSCHDSARDLRVPSMPSDSKQHRHDLLMEGRIAARVETSLPLPLRRLAYRPCHMTLTPHASARSYWATAADTG